MGTLESRHRAVSIAATIVMVVVSVVNAVSWALAGLTSQAWAFVAVGLLIGVFLLWPVCRRRITGWSRAWILLLFVVQAFGGWTTFSIVQLAVPASLAQIHVVWVVLFLVAFVTREIADASIGVARRADVRRDARRAEQRRIEANRERELEYSRRVERAHSAVAQASRPGALTGYEPDDLAGVSLGQPPHMYGVPGVGLEAAGYPEVATELGRQGERNFAKALAKAGLLDRFATFWSVHMPDQTLGASAEFPTDVDCVIITGRSVFLIDVKNFAQGDVTWVTEAVDDGDGRSHHQLVAVDNVTGGYVGQPRWMTRNMQFATDRFGARFTGSGIRLRVQPLVVMMPRPEGLGVVEGVMWPDAVPTVGLPDALALLAKERPFDPTGRDSELLRAMLKTLIKDDSGTAPMPRITRP
ncbi:NERD domain-containing protein [Microbacterium sp. cx-55]|uniref:nuclease-related domain-containing protein n=1 Tax=unclassified Microbacterium TaxID=2609290 RepID=UPI001CC17AEE|nr:MULTISPECIES: nuclease-related domain-containing protein [unclassified Microbacterium]MBZ4486813.1 NERD domain-containing protein [Microbacterium sp. cx-55]MCC4908116.1 NERD domain-containing protein [Microbacterium sp. cx-59]UGB35743.1 NERD domain-containing protein [Microbacterium sp. cx-55]